MTSITRKSLLYKSGVEYADYSLNHVEGCSHGCRYPCYAYLMKKRCGVIKTYEEWCKPRIVNNAMVLLNREIPKLRGIIDNVHLCFTTDPFMYKQKEINMLSMDIIETLNANKIRCNILTKGIYPSALAEMSIYSNKNEYGITLVSLDENFRKEYEPNTAPFEDRISALRYLHDKGAKTWVSIEPYPTPNLFQQDLLKLLQSISFVDKIIFGALNYNAKTSVLKDKKEFYKSCVKLVISFCTKNKTAYHIKKRTI